VGCRDEQLRLPAFLDHYRRLGVDRFAVVDNGSRDSSREILLSAPDVDLYEHGQSGAFAVAQLTWYQQLFDRYGSHRWYVVADVDELLVYSGMESRDLHHAASALRGRGCLGMTAHMIDMYPDGPLDSHRYRPGQALPDACPLFDATGYWWREDGPWIGQLRGGARSRLFGNPHRCEKLPFFRHTVWFAHESPHYAVAYGYRPPAEGALLHFKLMHDFRDRVEVAIALGTHSNSSLYYRVIGNQLTAMSVVDPRFAGSRRYEGPQSLIDAGLLRPFTWSSPVRGRRGMR
jgi:hypothetical protein